MSRPRGPSYAAMPAPDTEPAPVAVTPADADLFPRHTGGGWYELSDGSKIQGKDEAAEAEVSL